MKYYLRTTDKYGSEVYYQYDSSFTVWCTALSNAKEFRTIEAAKSKGQELGGDFQIVNERFEVVWPR